MWWVERPPTYFEPNVDRRPCNVHMCSFQCAAGTCHFSHPRTVTLAYIPVCGRRVTLLCTHGQWYSCTLQCAARACHFLHPWPVTLLNISVCGTCVPLLAPMASDTRIHFRVRQARVTSYTHGQGHSCGSPLTLLATSDSIIFQRAWQQTRQTGVELI